MPSVVQHTLNVYTSDLEVLDTNIKQFTLHIKLQNYQVKWQPIHLVLIVNITSKDAKD